jgi:hypothetical protein
MTRDFGQGRRADQGLNGLTFPRTWRVGRSAGFGGSAVWIDVRLCSTATGAIARRISGSLKNGRMPSKPVR